MEIQYSKTAARALGCIPKNMRQAIHSAILGLTETPPRGDIKPLQGYNDGRMRLRVGSYRVIYRYNAQGIAVVLFILDVGPRGDIYK